MCTISPKESLPSAKSKRTELSTVIVIRIIEKVCVLINVLHDVYVSFTILNISQESDLIYNVYCN